MQQLIFTLNPAGELQHILEQIRPQGVFLLVDENTARKVLPGLQDKSPLLSDAEVVEISASDINKNLASLSYIWEQLSKRGATRSSVLVNIGGGMVTDIGGFAAATFKRGIRFLNVPTTLLGAVDAAVGGKTGINFCGLKNEIGAFCEADAVVISTTFFSTLPIEELLSGYAEMLKHGALSSEDELQRLLAFDIDAPTLDFEKLLHLLQKSVDVKRQVVASDPTEKGLRKVLNFGHTIGHAFESHAMEEGRPIPHGYAVAFGIVGELVLSHMLNGYASSMLQRVSSYIKEKYGAPEVTCSDYPRLLELMRHDKKNTSPQQVNFSLLDASGRPQYDQTATREEILTALDITRDLLGA